MRAHSILLVLAMVGCGSSANTTDGEDEETDTADTSGDETAWEDVELDPERSEPDGQGDQVWQRPERGPDASSESGTFAELDRVEVIGPLPVEVAREAAIEAAEHALGCYEDAIRRDRLAHGRVVLVIHVDPDGSVASSNDGGSRVDDPEIMTCFRNVAGRLPFPDDAGENTVTVTWVLSRGSS